MRENILAFVLLFTFVAASAQTKPIPKAKPPTQKEAEEKLKENQEESDDEPTEEEIREMEKLEIKMSSSNNIPQITTQQMKDANDVNKRIVPAK